MDSAKINRFKWDAAADGCDVGSFSIKRIADLESIPFPHDALYPDPTIDDIRGLADKFGPEHFHPESLELLLSFHSFLIRTANHTILVDLCCGNDKNRPDRPAWHMRKGPFIEDLANLGASPEDVDYVLCTHLHADHVGWNTKHVDGRWTPTFPNAQYLFAEKEYAHWQSEYDKNPPEPLLYGSFEDSVLPVVAAGQATMVAGEHLLETGIYLEPAYGHTPGSVLVHIEDGGDHGLLCGDAIHHPVQLAHPEWSTNFCTDPEQSRATRTALLDECAGTKTLLLPAHFQAPEYGRVLREGKEFRIER
ncbi:MAG: MBL fold metallo-hydrolase [Rhodospirillales bacterium]|nr:MBL fold metallo-hydrolase [Rhodospirillales bacterium]|tara:strand:+ start:240 stop:1157 length:918 start_codon:yes stop_codon:yes gene_type:complete